MGIRHQLSTYQPHLLKYLDSLDGNERNELAEHLLKFDFEQLSDIFDKALAPQLPRTEDVRPPNPDRYIDRETLSEQEMGKFFDNGLKAVSEGKVAALVLAGGQASRLGSDRPKGAIPLGTGLGSKADSLLFIQAAQIAKIQRMARQQFPNSTNPIIITWLIMTSQTTDTDTRVHLDEVLKETGLSWEQVIIFTQNEIPAFDKEGKAFLSSGTRLVTAPDGNGGIYDAIAPLLPELERRGLEYFHVYCVDNILCRVPDLHMIGCAIQMDADCAAKVVEKKQPTELVGHVCLDGGKIRVLEYSEISQVLREKHDPANPQKLLLRAGSIANHFFTLNFLKMACQYSKQCSMPFHIAHKRIPHLEPISGKIVQPDLPNGIKLERFIFDVFCLSRNFLCWQVPPDEEFSPLKNPNSAGRDCLSTCLQSLHSQHGKWIREAYIDCRQNHTKNDNE